MTDNNLHKDKTGVPSIDSRCSHMERRTGEERRSRGHRGIFAVHVVDRRRRKERRQNLNSPN